MTNEMSLSFSATLENEPFVRTCIASFVVCLNPTIDEIVEIKTIVGEAVSNAIIHGYNGDKGCLVKVKAYIEDDSLTIYVIDKGQGIQDIEKARQPMFTSKKELEHAGMGLSIIEALCDEMTIESSLELGTQLIMKKELFMNKEAVLNNIQLAQQGDEAAKELIVKNNLGLVWSIVHRFKNNYYDKEDLFQIGCIGLMKAINNFDVHYGVQFSTYAVPIIMGEIKRYFRDDGTIKVSRSLKELNIKINKAKEKLITLYGYEPTVQEIAKELEVDVMDVVEAIDASYYPTSLSEPIYEKDGSTISMEERIEDKHHTMWFEKIALKLEIEKLDEKERLILYMRYQLDFNQEKVAQRLNISQVQVSRLEKKIITKLRKHLNESH